MKRFKLILLLCAGVLAACNFTACKDDDDNDNANDKQETPAQTDSIVGSWEANDAGNYECYTFKANGEFTQVWTESNGKSGSDSGTYTYESKNLTLHYSDGYSEGYTVTLSGDQMVWTDEDGDSCVYTRK